MDLQLPRALAPYAWPSSSDAAAWSVDRYRSCACAWCCRCYEDTVNNTLLVRNQLKSVELANPDGTRRRLDDAKMDDANRLTIPSLLKERHCWLQLSHTVNVVPGGILITANRMAARIVDVLGDGDDVKLECLGNEAVDGAAFKDFFFATTPHTQHSHYMPREHRDFLPSAATASVGDVLYFVADLHELKNWSASYSKAHTDAEGTEDCKLAAASSAVEKFELTHRGEKGEKCSVKKVPTYPTLEIQVGHGLYPFGARSTCDLARRVFTPASLSALPMRRRVLTSDTACCRPSSWPLAVLPCAGTGHHLTDIGEGNVLKHLDYWRYCHSGDAMPARIRKTVEVVRELSLVKTARLLVCAGYQVRRCL